MNSAAAMPQGGTLSVATRLIAAPADAQAAQVEPG
jgi:hypothetical protein